MYQNKHAHHSASKLRLVRASLPTGTVIIGTEILLRLAEATQPSQFAGCILEMPCTQCTVLDAGNYPNPSFGPFARLLFHNRVFQLLLHSGCDIFDLSSSSPIFSHLYPCFVGPLDVSMKEEMECLGFDVDYGWWKLAASKMQTLQDMKIRDDPRRAPAISIDAMYTILLIHQPPQKRVIPSGGPPKRRSGSRSSRKSLPPTA